MKRSLSYLTKYGIATPTKVAFRLPLDLPTISLKHLVASLLHPGHTVANTLILLFQWTTSQRFDLSIPMSILSLSMNYVDTH